ncbi:MAG: metalloregulator ArsR/SmtB family transcription factor [Synechococcaceae cyanobacterium]|nr:metalloregulator ArsR/SmtB family transcription factor [Synechococcaceae cyanobacterium]
MSSVSMAPPIDGLGIDRAQSLLRVLAEPIRLQLVLALAHGERCVCELTAELQMAQPKLSFHLKVMKEAGLITARQQGRWVYYQLQPELLMALGDWLSQLCDGCQRSAAACR